MPAAKIRVADQWKNASDQAFDLGAILISSDLGSITGSLGFGSYPDAVLAGLTVEVCGYPVGTPDPRVQFHSRRGVHNVLPAFVEYRADTFGGQSGGPVMVPAQGRWWVVAVNTRPLSFGANAGVRVTPEIADIIRRWRDG
jgi:V8-like Glu-specific endopeptidase